jgi:phosphotransferase system HPr (HPr) family protein
MAQRFEADIEIAFNGKHASAKSLLSLLILSAEHGAVVTASAVGRDAKEAINAITGLFKSNFHEVPMSAPAHAS